MGLALLCEGALAVKEAAWACLLEKADEGEWAEEGVLQAGASSKEWPVCVVRKDPSELSLTGQTPAHSARSSVPLLAMWVSHQVLRKPCG